MSRARVVVQEPDLGHEAAGLGPDVPVGDPALREHAPLALAVARRRGVDLAVAERDEVGLRAEAVEAAGAPVGLVELAEGLEDRATGVRGPGDA